MSFFYNFIMSVKDTKFTIDKRGMQSCVSVMEKIMPPLPEVKFPINDTEKWGEQACV